MKGDGSLVDIGGRIQVLSGFAFPSTGFHESEGVPLIRIRDLSKGRTEVRFRGKYDAVFEVRAGDVLVGMDGDFSAVRWSGGLALLNQRVCKVAPKADCDLDDGYLYHSLQPQLDAIHRRTPQTTVRHLSGGDIYGIRLPLPPLPEQQLIASILDTVDEVIRKTEEVIAKLQQMKQGLLHDLLTRGIDDNGELRAPDRHPEQFKDSELGRIPKDWDVEATEDLCAAVVDCPHSTPNYIDAGVPCVRTADMLPGRLLLNKARRVSEDSFRERTVRLVPEMGDVIYSREGERLGIASPVGHERVCLGQRVMHLRPNTNVAPAFLLWAMNSSSYYRQVVGVVGATTSPHVNLADVRKFKIARPPTVEQHRFSDAMTSCEDRIAAEQAELQKLRLLKSGLMDDLLTGRVRVTDLLPTTTP